MRNVRRGSYGGDKRTKESGWEGLAQQPVRRPVAVSARTLGYDPGGKDSKPKKSRRVNGLCSLGGICCVWIIRSGWIRELAEGPYNKTIQLINSARAAHNDDWLP